jgi:hypothetical protein
LKLIYGPEHERLLIEFEIKQAHLAPQRFFPDREPTFVVVSPKLLHPSVVMAPWQEGGYQLGSLTLKGKNEWRDPDIYIRDVVAQFVESLDAPQSVFAYDHELLGHPAYGLMLQSPPQQFVQKCRAAADLKPLSEEAANKAAEACGKAFEPFVTWIRESRVKSEIDAKHSHEQWRAASKFQSHGPTFSDAEMKITIGSKVGSPVVVMRASSTTYIRIIKEEVETQKAIAIDAQTFQVEGKAFNDCYTLEEAGIKPNGPFEARIVLPTIQITNRPNLKCRLTLNDMAKRRQKDYGGREKERIATVLQNKAIGLPDNCVDLVHGYAALD